MDVLSGTNSLSMQEVESEESAVQSQSRIHSKFKASQGCSKLCLQTQQQICKDKTGDGDMTHCFTATVALPKDPSSIPSTGMVAHKHP